MNNINNSRTLITTTVIIIILVITYFLRVTTCEQRQLGINYSMITDSEIITDDKETYYAPIDQADGKDSSPEDLVLFIETYLCERSYSLDIDCAGDQVGRTELNIYSVDLNEDGEDEYIIMPWTVYGMALRGASGNGPILVVKKDDAYKVIGEFNGNGYSATNGVTIQFHDILVHAHSSAMSGTETLYRFSLDRDGAGSEGYEEIFSKWYRFHE